MLDSLSNKAILTKARAMYGKRLRPENYNEMMRMQSVSDITAYLKNETWYQDVLAPISEATAHRGQVENLIRRSVIDRYAKLLRYDFSKGKSFYSYLIIWSEIELILSCIRMLNSHSSDEFIISLPTYMIRYASFDLMGLAKARSFDDLLSVISHTQYYGIVKQFHPQKGVDYIDLIGCESAMLNFYYEKVFSLIQKNYKGSTAKQLAVIFGTEIDIRNVGLIYRLKRYYHYQPAQIRKHLVQVPGQMTGRVLDEMVDAADAEAMMAVLQKTRFGRFYNAEHFSHIENVTEKTNYYTNGKQLRFTIDAPVALVSYMNCIEIEVENIFCIIEGVRYRVPMEEIRSLLV